MRDAEVSNAAPQFPCPFQHSCPCHSLLAPLPNPQSLLARSLPPGVLHQEVQFDRFEEAADGSFVTLHFKGGRPPMTARLLVGADGGQSGIREQVLGDGPPLYQGEGCPLLVGPRGGCCL